MLYRFQIELSDIDRGVYETLDFRIAQHPSEIPVYLLTRALAYALSYREGLEFSSHGLADPDQPALLAMGKHGATDLIIEIGNPTARKLHKATKTAREVVVYTYKNPELLKEQIKAGDVHRGDEIKIVALESKFMAELESRLEKTNRWTVILQDGRLDVTAGGQTSSTELLKNQA